MGFGLPSSAGRKLESITRILEHLAKEASKGVPVIVEGRNDLNALSELNIRGRIVCIKNSGKIFADLLDSIQSRSIIVFVDFDKSGIDLAKKIASYSGSTGVKVNLNFWRRIRALIRRDVKDVEGIPSYLEKLKKRAGYFS
jgi:5S rRNA maturation endonuclease (ribonuclease M5)